jgi:hypothetical protein
MDTISPGLDDSFAQRGEVRLPRFLVSPPFWTGVSLLVLFGAVAFWRFGICTSRVLACGA